ncbi:MAG TPA: alpha/beta hydrolase [Dehalococcoidia bacterium]|jgi:pimeloyl-ACP methyl ester carboxylesterase
MEPWLQYTTTSDGVSIAYTVAGSGAPLIRVTGGLWDHAQGYWRIAPMRLQLERFASRFTHIQYDARGTGLSQRGVADFRLEAQLADLEAVAAANNADRFALMAHFTGGFAAMAFAARHPERVSHLILFRPHLRGTDYFNANVIRAMDAYRHMASEDWFGYLGTITNRAFRFEQPDLARQLVAVYNESMTPETVQLFEEQYRDIDVSAYVERIQAPTLIVVEAGRSGFPDDPWREIASMIPNVSLQMVRAKMPLAYTDEATDAILSFAGAAVGQHEADTGGGLEVVVFVAVGPVGAGREARLRELARSRGATRVQAEDGGFVLAFRSAQLALETAAALHAALAVPGTTVCIGIDAVDPSDANGDAQPSAKAAGVARLAGDGEVLVTDVVRQLVTGKGFLFGARAETVGDGEDSTRLYQLSWQT